MTVFVTGGTGFVGSVLIDKIFTSYPDAAVKALVIPGDPFRPILERLKTKHSRLTIVEGNILDAEPLYRSMGGCEQVVHCAGLISYWRRDSAKLHAVNVGGVRNMVQAAVKSGVRRFVHLSSVGSIGFYKDGRIADETTPFKWPSSFLYMTTKHEGQTVVEQAVSEFGLNAVIINPASIMGPGDPNPATPHNSLYTSVYRGNMTGSFAGGLAIVDVRDLCSIIVKAFAAGEAGERYLAVGANVTYSDVLRTMGKCAGKRVFPVPIPAPLLTFGGFVLEGVAELTGKRPLLTASYGRLSGWFNYYSNEKSKKTFAIEYTPFETTIKDSCAWYETTFMKKKE